MQVKRNGQAHIQTGLFILVMKKMQIACLQRIASATESMASSYTNLEKDRDYYKGLAQRRLEDIRYMEKQIAGLRGAITKLKNKLPH